MKGKSNPKPEIYFQGFSESLILREVIKGIRCSVSNETLKHALTNYREEINKDTRNNIFVYETKISTDQYLVLKDKKRKWSVLDML